MNCLLRIALSQAQIPPNVQHSCTCFEDNEAVIKMIIKGRSPTMRHVSRTHRVALVGFLSESTWTQKSKSNELTPKTQLADLLTKGNFTRDEWNHLLRLFHIMYLSMLLFSVVSIQLIMSKRSMWRNRSR